MTKSEVRVDRASIPYHVPSTGNNYGEGHFYSRMFTEDMARDLFPISGDVDRAPVFQLLSGDEHISRVIETAFVYYRAVRSLSPLLSAFGNQTAHDLFFSGVEAFEIAPMVDANGQIVGFLVLRLDDFRRFAGFTWQMIPKNALAGAHWENNPQPVNQRRVLIPRDRVVHIRLPREYRRIPRDLRALRHIGNVVPNFDIQNMSPYGTIQMPYDITELSEIEQRAVASITRSTGWNGRRTFNKAVTNYYAMCRFLRSEEFKIRLRDTVVDGINRILAVAGATVGFTAEVSLHHLPTLEEIAVSRNDLAAGRLGFSQMIDQYSIYRRGRVTSQE